MNQLPNKLQLVERDVANDKGALNLFAVLEREDLAGRWDLVVSAPWAKEDEGTLRYLTDALKRRLDAAEMTLLSRVVVLRATENPVLALNETFDVEHGHIEVNEPARFGLPVKHGYIITSRRAA
jgi:hypothetical protein